MLSDKKKLPQDLIDHILSEHSRRESGEDISLKDYIKNCKEFQNC